jgi:hypothetical protein
LATASVIHISEGGPTYCIKVGARDYYFEDHVECGPLFTDKEGNEKTPTNNDRVWGFVGAWYSQGKKYTEKDGIRYCDYKLIRMYRA